MSWTIYLVEIRLENTVHFNLIKYKGQKNNHRKKRNLTREEEKEDLAPDLNNTLLWL